MRKAIEDYARLSASSMMNEMISGLTAQLHDLLEGKAASSALREDVESWSVVRDDLQIGDETVFATFEAVATDPSLLNEIRLRPGSAEIWS
jgi:hypothetical protein